MNVDEAAIAAIGRKKVAPDDCPPGDYHFWKDGCFYYHCGGRGKDFLSHLGHAEKAWHIVPEDPEPEFEEWDVEERDGWREIIDPQGIPHLPDVMTRSPGFSGWNYVLPNRRKVRGVGSDPIWGQADSNSWDTEQTEIYTICLRPKSALVRKDNP